MQYLLIGGAERVGKTETIYRLAQYLDNHGFKIVNGQIPAAPGDFCGVFAGTDSQGRNWRIALNTASDTPAIITNFKNYYDQHGPYDLLISSVRDDHFWPRQDFFRIMNIAPNDPGLLEVPLARITRRQPNFPVALNWYTQKIDTLVVHILSQKPFEFW